MAVTVILSRFGDDSGHPNEVEVIENGKDFIYGPDGSLAVVTAVLPTRGRNLAVYPPGRWLAAHVDEEVRFATSD